MSGLKEWLMSHRKGLDLGEGSIDKIIYYVERKNFLQIYYTHKLNMLQLINEFFEDQEAYEYCALIRDTVLNNNKATGTQAKLCFSLHHLFG